jgi:hypothetical protein
LAQRSCPVPSKDSFNNALRALYLGLIFGFGLLDAACQPVFTQSYSKLLSQPVRIGKACDNDGWLSCWVFAIFKLVNQHFASG